MMRSKNNAFDILAGEVFKAGMSLEEATAEFHKSYILTAISCCEWNQCLTARSLGIHRNTLSRKIQQLGISIPATAARKNGFNRDVLEAA